MKPLASSRKPGNWAGRIRQNDDSLEEAGIHKGDEVEVDLKKQPRRGELCVAFTADRELVIRYFHEEVNGDIRLSRSPNAEKSEVFAPGTVMILGRVREVIQGNPH